MTTIHTVQKEINVPVTARFGLGNNISTETTPLLADVVFSYDPPEEEGCSPEIGIISAKPANRTVHLRLLEHVMHALIMDDVFHEHLVMTAEDDRLVRNTVPPRLQLVSTVLGNPSDPFSIAHPELPLGGSPLPVWQMPSMKVVLLAAVAAVGEDAPDATDAELLMMLKLCGACWRWDVDELVQHLAEAREWARSDFGAAYLARCLDNSPPPPRPL
jgi:hypothetical protein